MRRPALPGEAVAFGERCLRRFLDVEGTMQATVLAAQAFTSLIPFMVVSAALAPGKGDLTARIIERFDLEGSSARSVEALFNSSGEVESAVTWVSVVILVLSALSFTRALQRTSLGLRTDRHPQHDKQQLESRHHLDLPLLRGFIPPAPPATPAPPADRPCQSPR